MAAAVASVADMLGVPRSKQDSPLALAHSIEEGLPLAALERLSQLIAPGDTNFRYRLVPRATLSRRLASTSRRLSNEEGNRLARIAKVFAFAEEVFGSDERARTFLQQPHPMLENKSALEIAIATDPGADIVMNLIGRVAYGAAA